MDFGELQGMRKRDFTQNFREQYQQWQAQQRQQQYQAGGNRPQQQQQHWQQHPQPPQDMQSHGGQQQLLQQQQQQGSPAAGFDGLVEALDARFGNRQPAAAAAVAGTATPAAGSPYQQQGSVSMQNQWSQLPVNSQGDVYYDGVLASDNSSSSSSGDSRGVNSSWQQGEWGSNLQAPQQQYQQQQHQEQERGSEGARELGNHLQRSVNRFEQTTAALQLSGLELYGTWLGCLMQPVGTVPVAGGGGGGAAAAAGGASAAGGEG
jgi:hypothetical protein